MAGVAGTRSIDSFVSRFSGLVEYVNPMSFPPDSIPDILFSSRTADAGYLTGTAADAFSMGPGSTTDAARRACIGEALERFSLASARPAIFQAVGADDRQVAPDRFARFHESQYALPGFRFERIEPGDIIGWAHGHDVSTGEHVLVPAQMALFVDPHAPGDPRAPGDPHTRGGVSGGEKHYELTTSSGVAAGPNFAFAAKRAILELIERDAFQRTWLRQRRPVRFDWRRAPQLTSATVRELDRLESLCRRFRASFSVRVLDSALAVPVLLAVVRSGITGVAVGCAADIDLDRAVLNAVREAIHTHNWCLRLLADPSIEPSDVTEFEHHVAYHCTPAARELSSALDGSTAAVTRVDAPSGWPNLVETLSRTGTRVYLVDVTSEEIAEAGFSVIRALSPDLIPLDVLHDARFLGSPALYDEACPGPEGLTSIPHPFP